MTGGRIPATVVTGFLGAGKTTLIRNLIGQAQGRRIAVIVNEFGDLGFDGALVSDCGDAECRPASIVELTNGCICCTIADEFLPTMEALLCLSPPPDGIVIETSGLALPQPLVRAFAWPDVRHRVTVDAVVAVVDADAVAAGRLAPDPAAVREALAADPAIAHDDPIEELFEDQLRCADIVVVAKSDLLAAADLARVEDLVGQRTRPGTAMVRGTGSGLPPRVLLGLSAAAESDMAGRESHHELEGEEHEHDDFVSFVVRLPPSDSLDGVRARVAAALAVPGVLRIKGHAGVVDKVAAAVVQAVGSRVETWFAPEAEAAGLTVIGLRGLDRAAVAAALGG
jgi:cobalamin biosynthesis protein CobW